MPARVSPARSAAFDILMRVETRHSYTSELLHSNLLANLSGSDRALTTELVMGTLRWQQKLDGNLEQASGKSIAKFDLEVKLALRLGAYQLQFLDRVPARAAVNESVELVKRHGKRSAAPLVNAVLRKMEHKSPSSELSTESVKEIAEAYSHPEWLVERWARAYSGRVAVKICEHNQRRPHTTIRFAFGAMGEELARQGIELEPGTIVSDAWRVVRGDVSASPAYRERQLAIQDEGSQLIALLAQGPSILDCCAAPGGKSLIASQRNPGAVVVSADLHLHRAKLMRELTGSSTIVAADARLLPFSRQFDAVIADLPCTGTGTLARNPEIKWRLTRDDLPRLASLQAEILESAAQVAQSIVYSTCSIESEEGEEVIAEFLLKHPQFRLLPIRTRLEQLAAQKAIRSEAVDELIRGDFLRTIPGIHDCDGFFAAILTTASLRI